MVLPEAAENHLLAKCANPVLLPITGADLRPYVATVD
jgi:hypothetical protein